MHLRALVVRAAFGGDTPGAARWLRFALPFWLRLTFLLIPGLPAVLDLRQQDPDFLNVFLSPAVQAGATYFHNLRRGYFPCRDVAAKSLGSQSKLYSSLSRGKHYAPV